VILPDLCVLSPRTAGATSRSNEYPLHLVERHFLRAAIVELRRARARMVRHLRCLLKGAAVLQVRGDARRPKRVVANLGRDAGRPGAPLDHLVGVGLGQGIAGELAGRAAVGLEQERLRVARKARAVDVLVQIGFEVVVARHGVLLAAFLVQANP